MRKLITILLLAALCLCMAACNKTEPKSAAVKAVEAAIDNLGPVTQDSGEAIAQVRAQYNALSVEDRSLVKNYRKLVTAENDFANFDNGILERVQDILAAKIGIGALEDLRGLPDHEYVRHAKMIVTVQLLSDFLVASVTADPSGNYAFAQGTLTFVTNTDGILGISRENVEPVAPLLPEYSFFNGETSVTINAELFSAYMQISDSVSYEENVFPAHWSWELTESTAHAQTEALQWPYAIASDELDPTVIQSFLDDIQTALQAMGMPFNAEELTGMI